MVHCKLRLVIDDRLNGKGDLLKKMGKKDGRKSSMKYRGEVQGILKLISYFKGVAHILFPS